MLTGFQFRAALVATRQMDQEVAKNTSLTPATILRLKKTTNFEYLQCNNSTIKLLVDYFNSIAIFFPRENCIEDQNLLITKEKIMNHELNRFQFTCARAASMLTQSQLAQKLNISPATISLLENQANETVLKFKKLKPIEVREFFQNIGVIFENSNILFLTQEKNNSQ
jgi:DNA-binding XRE family transcriptional regulator